MIRQGVYKTAKGFGAVLYAPKASQCRIRLYRHGSDEVTDTFSMEKDRNSEGFFVCSFATDADEYCFECDGKRVRDPYATGVAGRDEFFAPHYAFRYVLPGKCVRNRNDVRVHHSFNDLIIYKLHVRTFTMDESSGVKRRGTFSGVSNKAGYIKKLGVNAVLLMPVYEFDEVMPAGFGSKAKPNVWGYGADAQYFAVKRSFAADPSNAAGEFINMVRNFHRAGIEVLMEMYFSADTPDVMAIDALRFWHEQYGVDGFRLMGDGLSLKAAATDPALCGVKLISESVLDEGVTASVCAEVGTIGEGFMTVARRFIKGDENMLGDFAAAFRDKGGSGARINYITDHDSFTLADLYSYDVKHNETNMESGRDGREINYSWNCGTEGETANTKILALRKLMCRNAMAVLLLSQGTPMIMAGDEMLSSHRGNNNPYCCDNAEGYVIWNKTAAAREMTGFVKKLTALRRSHRVFSNFIPLRGTDYIYKGNPDISYHGVKAWYPDFGYYSRTLGVMLNGDYALIGRDKTDETYYIAFNMHWEEHEFGLPVSGRTRFELVMATDAKVKMGGARSVTIPPRSIAVFIKKNEEA